MLLAVGIVLVGAGVGAILGFLYGGLEANSIAEKIRAEDSSDPGDMLHMVILGYLMLGTIGGTLLGLLIAAVIFANRRQDRIDRQKMQTLKS